MPPGQTTTQPLPAGLTSKNVFGFGMRVVNGFLVHDEGVELPGFVMVSRLRINIEQCQIDLRAEFVDFVAAQ